MGPERQVGPRKPRASLLSRRGLHSEYAACTTRTDEPHAEPQYIKGGNELRKWQYYGREKIPRIEVEIVLYVGLDMEYVRAVKVLGNESGVM